MKLLGPIILLTLGLPMGAFAQESAQGGQPPVRVPDQAPALERQIKARLAATSASWS